MSRARLLLHGRVGGPPPPPPPPPLGGIPLGINMIEIDYWTNSCPFNNLIYGEVTKYTSGPFSGSLTDVPAVNLDTEQWPKTLPNVGAYIARILSNPIATGTYDIAWSRNMDDALLSSGPASLTGFNNTTKTASLSVTDAVPNAVAPLILKYTITDLVNYAKPISIRPAGSTGTFTTKFLTDVGRFTGPIRFVKWNQAVESNSGNQAAWAGGTQGSPTRLITWANRNSAVGGDWKSYDGVPIEIMVELANTANRDMHVNIPWNADDAWITGVATYVRDHLNAGLKCRFECSNEVWNSGYNVYFQAGAEGLAEGLPDGGHGGGFGLALYRYAERVYEMMSLITPVFSGQMSRIVRLSCWQHANAWAPMEVYTWAATNRPLWITQVDAFATAPYFSTMSGNWSFTGDPATVFDEIRTYIDTFLTPDAAYHKATALSFGKVLTTYEGGPSLLFTDAAYMATIQRHSRMYTEMRYYLSWLETYFSSAILFAMTHPIGAINAWGLKEYEGQTISLGNTPKFQAVIDHLAGV